MGNYDNNLWNTHSPYCLFLFILLFCRVELLQKHMKKSLSAISNTSEIQHPTLPHLHTTCTVLSFHGEPDKLQRRAETEEVLRAPTEEEFIW